MAHLEKDPAVAFAVVEDSSTLRDIHSGLEESQKTQPTPSAVSPPNQADARLSGGADAPPVPPGGEWLQVWLSDMPPGTTEAEVLAALSSMGIELAPDTDLDLDVLTTLLCH